MGNWWGQDTIEIGVPALVLLGLMMACWTAAAAWTLLAARRSSLTARRDKLRVLRMTRMMDEAPALPLLVRADGRIEASDRLAGWFGLDALPNTITELAGEGARGVPRAEIDALYEHVRRTLSSAAPFRMVLHPQGEGHALAVTGHLADPQVSRGGAVLVWLVDASDSATQIARLTESAERARTDFSSLVGLIEAAPVPMWFRAADGRLRLVNSAYVAAVGGESAEDVVASNIELVEEHEGVSAKQVALEARKSGQAIQRNLMATIEGERRAVKVSDLPVGDEGIAGYAIDVEEFEMLAREYRAFRAAQRALLDQLSSGVAQFDAGRNLIFVNLPMQRLFRLPPSIGQESTPIGEVFGVMRDAGRLPEVRDFPAWRREKDNWFTASEAQDEEWVLPDGSHLRIVAQPMPDGGLMMIVEDRTEQLQLASARDTLLRVRTAMQDSLFEGVAVIAPDGCLQLWNRRFASEWSLSEDFLGSHPHIDALLEALAPRLNAPSDARRIGMVIEAATLRREQTGGRVTLSDGRTMALMGVPLPDGNGMLTSLDITDSQKAEAALLERNQALVEADAVKTRFLANMSYEFRTPLTSITGFAEMLRDGVAGELSEAGAEYVTAILESTARLSDQIESVLDLTQSEAGLLPLARETIELMPLMTRLVHDRAQNIEAAGITLNLRGDRTAGTVIGDPRRLARAIGNVIDNAIAVTGKDGRINIDLKRRREGPRIMIHYQTGATGPEAEIARQNAGLGLPLARELIEAHDGSIEFMQHANSGITATIALP
ncbi:PAS domain-containing sensor histidine kinase [Croceicoccus naphthovorans]|uniref:histidine kinase n=1 Tax=Croceicoccus naphthovorans TaxID=1348774 RepID=A0A0G3XDT0_9SPHN|nr:PAS domain-containing sensor histidine kinase [Croceicoccus naphthovorans]AKM09695.1 histidine kinase [Croceicoccus naphthovorans]MBB3990827.1 signal transduction histidine kinase [Croceicoccus naphthovorans]